MREFTSSLSMTDNNCNQHRRQVDRSDRSNSRMSCSFRLTDMKFTLHLTSFTFALNSWGLHLASLQARPVILERVEKPSPRALVWRDCAFDNSSFHQHPFKSICKTSSTDLIVLTPDTKGGVGSSRVAQFRLDKEKSVITHLTLNGPIHSP